MPTKTAHPVTQAGMFEQQAANGTAMNDDGGAMISAARNGRAMNGTARTNAA